MEDVGAKLRKLSADELKKLELEMLKDVARFCDENGLRYYLCGGTLLGAVRHKGFIPWDDDMDIAMPRADYDVFLKTYNAHSERYQVNGIENNDQYCRPFARVEDHQTVVYEKTLKKKYQKCHVWVDVFPMGGIPNTPAAERQLMLRQKALEMVCNASSMGFSPSRHYSDSKEAHTSLRNTMRTWVKYLAILLFSGVNTQYIVRKMNENARKYEYEAAQDVGLTSFIWGWRFEKASRKAFAERRQFQFEDGTFWGPAGYDEYLTKTYGDYMTPPPIQNQVSHHSFEAYLKA